MKIEAAKDYFVSDPEFLDAKATEWVNNVSAIIFQTLERSGVTYNDEMVCHLLADGFKAGYCVALTDSLAELERLKKALIDKKWD